MRYFVCPNQGVHVMQYNDVFNAACDSLRNEVKFSICPKLWIRDEYMKANICVLDEINSIFVVCY